MLKNIIKISGQSLFSILLVTSITGCGGGGGGSASPDPLASLPYTGVVTAVVFDPGDIEDFMLSAYYAPSYLSALTQDTAVPQQVDSQSSATGVAVLSSEPGPCGGLANYDLDVNKVTGDFSGDVFYDGFNDCEAVMTGAVLLSGQLDLVSMQFNSLKMVFELLKLTDNALGALVLSGSFNLSQSGLTDTISFDLRARDESTGKVYWFDNYKITVLHGYDSRAYAEETLSGRYYDPDQGFVDVHTVAPVRTYEGDDWPSSGIFIAEGATDASVRMNFLSPVLYQVEADVDGDDVYEYDSGRLHYPGANTLPVVDAGTDATGNLGCSVALDGSNSEDADLDALQYEWTVAIAPAGSLSQLTNATSPKPSFNPDIKGEYQFSLSISDGFDTVVDTVNLTAYGDLFCIQDATVTPYAQINQYEADLAIGDVTSDGRADVLALTQEAELYVFKQNLSGGLDNPVLHKVDNWRAVMIGDVTGDGKNDAVVTTDTGVGVLKQSDTGELSTMVEYLFDPPLASSAYTYSLALGYFDNDDRLDVAVLPQGGPVYVFLQNNDGTLGSPSTYETAMTGWSQVLAGDVTGDGLTDIVLSRVDSYGSNNIGVLPQAAGGFAATVYYTIGDLPNTSTNKVILGDLNGDSRSDLAYDLYNFSNGATSLGVRLQASTGSFDAPIIYDAYYPPIYDMTIADVTGDRRNDLVALHGTPDTSKPFSPTTVAVLAATEAGPLASYDRYPVYQAPQSWGGLAVGDVDNDGKNDVVVTAHGCDEVSNCLPNLVVLHGVK